MTTLLQQLSEQMAGLAAGVQRSLVQLTDSSGSIGAGTIWHPEGLIITNAHVVAEHQAENPHHRSYGSARQRQLTAILSDGRRFPAAVLAADPQQDLAALAIDASGLPTIEPGDSKALRPGHWVMALGHPWGVRDALTAGIVIGAGDDLPEMQPGREWLALNLTLRPGHSGGPLVDTSGRLVGVNTMISGPEVGFAVPAHVVKRFLRERLGERVADAVAL